MRLRLSPPFRGLLILALLGALVAAGLFASRHDLGEAPRAEPHRADLHQPGHRPGRGPPAATAFDPETLDALGSPMFDVMPMHRIVRAVSDRFHGRIIALALVPALRTETEAGVDLVYAVRLLTPARDVLDIRLDARDGRFLDVRGANIPIARKKSH